MGWMFGGQLHALEELQVGGSELIRVGIAAPSRSCLSPFSVCGELHFHRARSPKDAFRRLMY